MEKKFQILRYGKNQNVKMDTVYFTSEMAETIEPFNTLRNLGVILIKTHSLIILNMYAKR